LVSPDKPDMSWDGVTDRASDYMFMKELLQGMAITFGMMQKQLFV